MSDRAAQIASLSPEQLKQLIGRLKRSAPQALPRAPRDGSPLPLSFAQERLWFLDRLGLAGSAYNMPATARLTGRLDVAALASALGAVVERHEALRTALPSSGGRPFQHIAPCLALPLPVVDLSGLPLPARDGETARVAREDAERPFDIARGPVVRALLLRERPESHVLQVTLHHAVGDGWSLGVLVRELAALYEGRTLPGLPVQYADYAVWQREHLQGELLEQALAFWRRALDGTEPLALPADFVRPARPSARGAERRVALSEGSTARLQDLARGEGATLFMALLAVYQAVLRRLSGQTDFAVGVPAANRTRTEVEGLIGFFVNTLAIKVDLAGNPPFRTLLARAREATLEAFSHEELPFERIIHELQPERDLARNPLVQTLFSLQNYPWPELAMGEVGMAVYPVSTETAKLDLSLIFYDDAGRLSGTLEYATDLFTDATAEALARRFAAAAASAVADPDRGILDLDLMSEAERAAVLAAGLGARSGEAQEASLPGLFAAAARAHPEAVALDFGAPVTYAELDARSNRLAHHLRRLGVDLESRVGLAVERTAEMVVGMLGILKAGAAYVPLDPSYPAERLAFMIDDADLCALVCAEGAQPDAPLPKVLLGGAEEGEDSSAPPVAVPPDALAYVMYTSGSTGLPKGTAIPHRAVVRLVIDSDYVRLAPSDRVAQVSNASFDAATFEVWGALLSGACLVGIPRAVALSPEALAKALAVQRITAMFVTTALFNQLARQGNGVFRGLRHLLFGGEAVDPETVRRTLSDGPPERLLHVYGPTETTTFATWHEVGEVPPNAATVPIGGPLARSSAWLVDERGGLAPEGVPGELLLGGWGLARGYHRRPELTAERFLPHPWSAVPGERLYKTGDLVRRRPGSGAVEFLGRLDQQVKVRGFRVEPAEIEAALAAHPAVAECAVVARRDASGEKILVAFVVGREGAAPGGADLRPWLAARLPAYMVPARWVALDALPVTPNGKVDRRGLAARELPVEAETAPEERVAPRTAVERAIAEIWGELLGREGLGVSDNFFELGGHSLLATQVVSRLRERLGVEVPLTAVFEHPRLEDLAVAVEAEGATATAAPDPIERTADTGEEVLSFAQERLWFLEQLEPGTAFYNIPAAARLSGPLRVDVLAAAVRLLVERHEALRTTFVEAGGRPFQVVAPAAEVPLTLTDLSTLDDSEAELQRLATEETRRPFDLARGPLLRVPLFRLSPDEHVLVPTMHHIVSDGWSMTVLLRELGQVYAALSAGGPSPLAPLTVRYRDYAAWQRRHLEGGLFERGLEYWRARLEGVPGIELPTDRPRPPVETFKGRQRPAALSAGETAALHDFANREGVTLFMTLLAVFKVLLLRSTGQTDLAVGSPIANRNRADLEGVIGFFANTLVLRTDAAGDPTFRGLLARVRETTLGAYAHEEIPFERLVDKLAVQRDMSRNPLFQVMLVLQNQPWPVFRIGDVSLAQMDLDSGTAKFDLTFFWREHAGALVGLVEHNTDLFDDATARRLETHYLALLRSALAQPEAPVGGLGWLAPAERHQVQAEWSRSGAASTAERCVHRWVEAQAAATPALPAVVEGGLTLTYAELNARANRLAHALMRRGVGPEKLVGICLERSAAMVVAALGVLKSGGALVALDPAYPVERLAAILDDAGLCVLLTQSSLLRHFPGREEIALLLEPGDGFFPGEREDDPRTGVALDNPIYAIYTSGSTGQPKGIVVTHRAFANLLAWQLGDSGLAPRARTVQLSTFGFCVSFQEMFTSWCSGGSLVVADEATRRDVAGLASFLEAHGVERLHLPFAALKGLAEAAGSDSRLPASLTEVITAGEQLQVTPAVRRLFERLPGCSLSNQYGASETHVVTALTLEGEPRRWPAIPPVGRPIANVSIHLLDADLQPVPLGVAGELYAGGAAVPRCYLNDPVLTAQKVVPDPWSGAPGARLYRTGDAARWLPDGSVEYHGRLDTQVKIRGFRVELGEIDTVLARHPRVKDVAVLAKPGPAGPRLVAYVVPADAEPELAEALRAYLKQKLPEHMLPAAYVALERLPVNANGKLDQAALPEPEISSAVAWVAPRTPVEAILTGFYGDLLGVERVGVDDDFFALGGHSLLATRLISQVRDAFGVDLKVRALFESPTVAALALAIARALIEQSDDGAVATALAALHAEGEQGG